MPRASSCPPDCRRRLNSGTKPGEKAPSREQAAEDVGQQEGEVERVVGVARAEHAAADHVAREAEHAADHGQPADRADRLVEVHAASAPALRRCRRRLAVGRAGCRRRRLLRLRRLELRHVGRAEIDRVEQQRREADVLDRSATIWRANGNSRRGASTSRNGASASSGTLRSAEQAGVAQVDEEVRALVRLGRTFDAAGRLRGLRRRRG